MSSTTTGGMRVDLLGLPTRSRRSRRCNRFLLGFGHSMSQSCDQEQPGCPTSTTHRPPTCANDGRAMSGAVRRTADGRPDRPSGEVGAVCEAAADRATRLDGHHRLDGLGADHPSWQPQPGRRAAGHRRDRWPAVHGRCARRRGRRTAAAVRPGTPSNQFELSSKYEGPHYMGGPGHHAAARGLAAAATDAPRVADDAELVRPATPTRRGRGRDACRQPRRAGTRPPNATSAGCRRRSRSSGLAAATCSRWRRTCWATFRLVPAGDPPPVRRWSRHAVALEPGRGDGRRGRLSAAAAGAGAAPDGGDRRARDLGGGRRAGPAARPGWHGGPRLHRTRSLVWVQDLAGWATGVARMLAPGGRFVLFEGHPIEWLFDVDEDGDWVATDYDYFAGPEASRGWAPEYIDHLSLPDAQQSLKFARRGSSARSITALLGTDLRLERVTEHPVDWWRHRISTPAPRSAAGSRCACDGRKGPADLAACDPRAGNCTGSLSPANCCSSSIHAATDHAPGFVADARRRSWRRRSATASRSRPGRRSARGTTGGR